LLGDVKETLAAVLPKVNVKEETGHLDGALANYARARKDLDSLADIDPNTRAVHPQYVTKVVSELASEDAIFTCDVGTPIAWTARYLKVNGGGASSALSITAPWPMRCCMPSAPRPPSPTGR